MLKNLFKRKEKDSLEKTYNRAINSIYEAKANKTNFVVVQTCFADALMEMLKTRYTVFKVNCNTLKVVIY